MMSPAMSVEKMNVTAIRKNSRLSTCWATWLAVSGKRGKLENIVEDRGLRIANREKIEDGGSRIAKPYPSCGLKSIRLRSIHLLADLQKIIRPFDHSI